MRIIDQNKSDIDAQREANGLAPIDERVETDKTKKVLPSAKEVVVVPLPQQNSTKPLPDWIGFVFPWILTVICGVIGICLGVDLFDVVAIFFGVLFWSFVITEIAESNVPSRWVKKVPTAVFLVFLLVGLFFVFSALTHVGGETIVRGGRVDLRTGDVSCGGSTMILSEGKYRFLQFVRGLTVIVTAYACTSRKD